MGEFGNVRGVPRGIRDGAELVTLYDAGEGVSGVQPLLY